MALTLTADIRTDMKKLKAQEDKLSKLKNASLEIDWMTFYKVSY